MRTERRRRQCVFFLFRFSFLLLAVLSAISIRRLLSVGLTGNSSILSERLLRLSLPFRTTTKLGESDTDNAAKHTILFFCSPPHAFDQPFPFSVDFSTSNGDDIFGFNALLMNSCMMVIECCLRPMCRVYWSRIGTRVHHVDCGPDTPKININKYILFFVAVCLNDIDSPRMHFFPEKQRLCWIEFIL